MTNKRETVGKLAADLLAKDYEPVTAIDLQRAITNDNGQFGWENQLSICVERGMKQFEGNFYVVVLLRKERTIKNVIRSLFFPRKSCPTPTYDQTVFCYHRDSSELEYLWTVPDERAVQMLMLNKPYLKLEQMPLAEMCEDFASGKLLELAKTLNREIAA